MVELNNYKYFIACSLISLLFHNIGLIIVTMVSAKSKIVYKIAAVAYQAVYSVIASPNISTPITALMILSVLPGFMKLYLA